MLLLVRADGHKVALVEQDVRGHEHGIGQKARVDVVGVLLRLILELGHAPQLAHVGEAPQEPGELAVRGHVALAVHDVLLRVQTAGDEQGQRLRAAAAQGRRVLAHGQGVQVHHAVDAVVLPAVLQGDPVAKRADIVAQRQDARGLNAAEDRLFLGRDFRHLHLPPKGAVPKVYDEIMIALAEGIVK